MSNYRTPNISEFIQGFEYEEAFDYESGIIDLTGTHKMPDFVKHRSWQKKKVWWKEDPGKWLTTTNDDGITFIRKASLDQWFAPTNIEYLLKQHLIRVKIKKDDK